MRPISSASAGALWFKGVTLPTTQLCWEAPRNVISPFSFHVQKWATSLFHIRRQSPVVKRWRRHSSVDDFRGKGQSECSHPSVRLAASRHPAARQGKFAIRWLSSDALSNAKFHQLLWKVFCTEYTSDTFKLPSTYHWYYKEKCKRFFQAWWY